MIGDAPYADRIIVQTGAMALGLKESYQGWANRDWSSSLDFDAYNLESCHLGFSQRFGMML